MPFCNTQVDVDIFKTGCSCLYAVQSFVNEHFSNDNLSVCTVFFCMTSAFGWPDLSKAPHCVMQNSLFFDYVYNMGCLEMCIFLLRFNTFSLKMFLLDLCWTQSATTCNGKKTTTLWTTMINGNLCESKSLLPRTEWQSLVVPALPDTDVTLNSNWAKWPTIKSRHFVRGTMPWR